MALYREICEKQLVATWEHEDKSLQKLLMKTAQTCVEVMNYTSQILYIVIHMGIDDFVNSTSKFLAWGKSNSVIEFCKTMISQMKEELLTAKFDITPMTSAS